MGSGLTAVWKGAGCTMRLRQHPARYASLALRNAAPGCSRSTILASLRRLALPRASTVPGPGTATFIYETLTQLHAALDRVYKLAMSLPDAPLLRFRAETAKLPRTTEAERLVIQRIGQNLFRDALMDYWGGRCPLTGITEPALLRASHILPWSDCNDEQRLDVHNGLLLSALWDAAFDCGLVSFADDGKRIASPLLGEVGRRALAIETAPALRGLRDAHRANLAAHRARHGF